MARSKIDQMRSMVRRAEKAEAKLTKREMENIENGRKAREVLKVIEQRADGVIDKIAEAYTVGDTEIVDGLLNSFIASLNEIIAENTVETVTKSRTKREKKVTESEEKVVETTLNSAEPVDETPEDKIEDFRMDFEQPQTGFDPNAGYNMQQNASYQAGGIQYVPQ